MGVDGGVRVVEQIDVGVCVAGARERDSGALAPGEVDAALADLCGVFPGEFL